jgi:uncharacterized protein YdaU (DUF1376 family)
MNDAPWFKFYASDWLAGTRGMSAAEMGVYITLLAMMYDEGGPVRDDESRLARRCGIAPVTFRKIRQTLIDEGKIHLTDAGLINDRAVEELACRGKVSEAARESAFRRWDKKTEKSKADGCERNAEAMRNACYPDTRDTLEEINSSKDGEAVAKADPLGDDPNRRLFSDRVIRFVIDRSTAKDEKSARALIGKWKRLAKDDAQALIDALSRARNQNIADLSAWMPKALTARDGPRQPFWRPGMPVAASQGQPDVFGRSPDHPLYGSAMAL